MHALEFFAQLHFHVDVVFVHADVAVVDADTNILQIVLDSAPLLFASRDWEILFLKGLIVKRGLTWWRGL